VRGASGDLWADIVVGKPDFTEISPNTEREKGSITQQKGDVGPAVSGEGQH
jgi:hypothetical protein